jgi:hypothetical protein
MTFAGPALDDVKTIRRNFPRQFTHEQVMSKLGWTKAKARQAIVMGVSQDYFRIMGEHDPDTRWVTYENVEWRQQWITSNWGVSDEWRRELAG